MALWVWATRTTVQETFPVISRRVSTTSGLSANSNGLKWPYNRHAERLAGVYLDPLLESRSDYNTHIKNPRLRKCVRGKRSPICKREMHLVLSHIDTKLLGAMLWSISPPTLPPTYPSLFIVWRWFLPHLKSWNITNWMNSDDQRVLEFEEYSCWICINDIQNHYGERTMITWL